MKKLVDGYNVERVLETCKGCDHSKNGMYKDHLKPECKHCRYDAMTKKPTMRNYATGC